MLGLWSLGTVPIGLTLHLAFEAALVDLMDAPRRLDAKGITPLSFYGAETTEPSVIGWMPAASLYFRDPDGHLLEYLTMLDEEPNPDLGIVSGPSGLAQVIQTRRIPRVRTESLRPWTSSRCRTPTDASMAAGSPLEFRLLGR